MIAVIGCGNLVRGDDGAGPEVIRALFRHGLSREPMVRLLDAGTDGMAVMFAARGCRSLILVDASQSGSPAGAVFEVPGVELARRQESPFTLHDFRWQHALYAGRQMMGEAFPGEVTVFLIEAQTTAFGMGLTPCVAQAVQKVATRIEHQVRARLQHAEGVQ